MFKKYFYSFLLLLLSLVIISCADSITESTPSIDEVNDDNNVAPTFSDIQNNIFNQSCAFSGCHVSGAVNPNLSSNSHSNIVNKQSSTGMLLIKPNDPDNSYLLLKMIGSSGIQGSRMPLNSSPLSQDKIEALTEWINNGAPND
jgi:hypothetical protein